MVYDTSSYPPAFVSGLSSACIKDLAPHLTPLTAPGLGSYHAISQAGLRCVAANLCCSMRSAMLYCLAHEVWPLRFKGNRGVLTAAQQRRLLESHALIVGCGGLGGGVITLLARIGLGALTLCDKDSFDESNLNRQLLCREDRIGKNKALAAQEELQLIASHITVTTYPHAASAANLPDLVKEVQIAVDCLDCIPTRRLLEEAAHQQGIPFIHGSLAGWEGFAMACRPGFSAMQAIYGVALPSSISSAIPAEKRMGVPTLTPTATAVLQAQLVLKELLGLGDDTPFLLHLDIMEPTLESLLLTRI